MKKLNSKEILKNIEKRKTDIRKYGVKKIGLFGSFAKGKQHKKSDIDILVNFDKVNFDRYIELKFMLEKLFGRKVDLVIESDLRPELKEAKKEAKYVRV